jgi:site-specific DNA-methyltransferase (adenine-specific)
MDYTLHHGDCLEVMATMVDNSVDAIVTDPPYGLSFMGKRWDYDVPSVEVWYECLRVLKPGGHLLAFAGTRTQHRMAVRIEDAGFEIRDMIAWVYGSGFNKVGYIKDSNGETVRDGWGGSLKPALEPITVARKPLAGTVAANVLEHGTGALNVDGCRVGTTVETWPASRARPAEGHPNALYTHRLAGQSETQTVSTGDAPSGRWPANLIHDGSDEVVGLFPQTTSGDLTPYLNQSRNGHAGVNSEWKTVTRTGDSGSAARFFYCAKASKADRDEGCEGLPQTIKQSVAHGDKRHGTLPYTNEPREMNPRPRGNHHPTVKPADLMRYLCRLVTPPGGIVLDPFMGSGSTGKAAILEGFQFIGIEREAEYLAIAEARISHASGLSQPPQRPTRQPAPACPGQLALF